MENLNYFALIVLWKRQCFGCRDSGFIWLSSLKWLDSLGANQVLCRQVQSYFCPIQVIFSCFRMKVSVTLPPASQKLFVPYSNILHHGKITAPNVNNYHYCENSCWNYLKIVGWIGLRASSVIIFVSNKPFVKLSQLYSIPGRHVCRYV